MTVDRSMSYPTVVAPSATAIMQPAAAGYVDWPSIIAGAVISLSLTFVLLAFGSSIGLSVASPWTASGPSASTVGIAAALWFALVHIWAVGTGAYLTGRLRPKAHDSLRSEVSFRDGISGLVVWALAILLSAVLAASLVSAAARLTGQIAQTAANVTSSGVSALAPMAERAVDSAFEARPSAEPATQAGQPPSQAARNPLPDLTDGERARVMRIITTGISTGTFNQQDRLFFERLVAQKTGVSAEEAKARVTAALDNAIATAKQVAETARKATASAGFWSAIIFLLSGMAAWWAGCLGGTHRDESTL